MLCFLIALALAVLSALPASAQDAKTGRVAGTVVSGGSGRTDRCEYHLTLPQEIADRQRDDMSACAEGIHMTADEIIATRARRMIDVVRGGAASSPVGPESCEVPGW